MLIRISLLKIFKWNLHWSLDLHSFLQGFKKRRGISGKTEINTKANCMKTSSSLHLLGLIRNKNRKIDGLCHYSFHVFWRKLTQWRASLAETNSLTDLWSGRMLPNGLDLILWEVSIMPHSTVACLGQSSGNKGMNRICV